MNEGDYLETIKVDNLPESVSKILDNSYCSDYNLWNVFCLLSNGYTIWDGVDYRSEVREAILACATRPELEYLKVVINVPRMGVAFGRVLDVSVRNNKDAIWSVVSGDTEVGLFQGNGLTAFKRAIVENSQRYLREPLSFFIQELEVQVV